MDLTENKSEALSSILQGPPVVSQIGREVICLLRKKFAKTQVWFLSFSLYPQEGNKELVINVRYIDTAQK